MRRFVVLAAAFLVSAVILAQNNNDSGYGELFSSDVTTRGGKGELERFHGRLMFNESNELLSPGDVENWFWKKYLGARTLQDYGQYLWILGASWVATDLLISALYSGDTITPPSMIVGGICVLIGGAMDLGGWIRLGNLAKTYNNDPTARKQYSLNLGPTRSGGFGLSLSF
ncbi:MAG: hypothetical protein IJ840_05275 [Bacteroidales bacterium]|nr:hypothetical protein [Bacteroidales bacterium]